MEEESTKPYVYYERILNGILEIPVSIKQKLDHLILIKNEEQRVEEERQKEAEEQQQKEAQEREAEVEEERQKGEIQTTNLSEKFGQLYKTVSDFIPKTLTQESAPPIQQPLPPPTQQHLLPIQQHLLPIQQPLLPIQQPLPPAPAPAPAPQMRKCKIREW